MIIHLSKEGFKHIRKYLFWIVALVAITIYVFYNVFPEEFPNYQNKLFTVKSNSLITVNWIALIFCVIFSVRQLDRYRKTNIISNLVIFYLNIMYYLPGLLMCMIYETDEVYNSYYIIFWSSRPCWRRASSLSLLRPCCRSPSRSSSPSPQEACPCRGKTPRRRAVS